MRVNTAFKRLLRLDGVNVTSVSFGLNVITVVVALRRRRLVCPHRGHKPRFRYDTRPCPSRWRHLDLEVWQVPVEATLRRLRCPRHGVVVEAVPFARPGAHLTRDFDDLLAWLATRMDKNGVARLCRVSWHTVGRACARVVTPPARRPVGQRLQGVEVGAVEAPPRTSPTAKQPSSPASAATEAGSGGPMR